MKRQLAGVAVGSVLLVTLGTAGLARAAATHYPANWFINCTAVHQHWKHGIGKLHAHDHTSGTPVTDFKRNTRLYRHAISLNSDLDRDKDGIACEKA